MKIAATFNLGIVVIILFLFFNCSENSTNNDDVIPLDGRGGGIISYCYQPLQDDIHQIYVMNADGSGNRKMVESSVGLNHQDWSPDGQKLAATGYVSQSTWSIYVFNADGSSLTRLTTTENVNDSEPHWSPNGTHIVFTRIYPNQNNRTEIWIMDADGSSQQFIGVEGFAAKWSPDRSHFIYQSSFTASSDIYRCNVDGSNVQQITATTQTEINPVYSPDGAKIAYSTDKDSNHEIYIMNADGSDPARITSHIYEDYTPRWSPDGSRIAFNSGPHLEWEVFIVNTDGTNMRQGTNSPDNITAINPVWKPVD